MTSGTPVVVRRLASSGDGFQLSTSEPSHRRAQSLGGRRSLAPQSRPPDGAAVGGGERGDDGWRCRCALSNGQRHRRPRVHDPSRRAGCAQLPRRPPPAHPRTSVRLQLHKKTRSPAVLYDLRPTPSPAACLSLRRRGQLWATAWLCITVTIIVESDCITRGFSRRLQLGHLPLSLKLDGFPVDLDLEDLGRGLGARHGHTCWGGFRGRHRGLLRDAAGTEALLDCGVDEEATESEHGEEDRRCGGRFRVRPLERKRWRWKRRRRQ